MLFGITKLKFCKLCICADYRTLFLDYCLLLMWLCVVWNGVSVSSVWEGGAAKTTCCGLRSVRAWAASSMWNRYVYFVLNYLFIWENTDFYVILYCLYYLNNCSLICLSRKGLAENKAGWKETYPLIIVLQNNFLVQMLCLIELIKYFKIYWPNFKADIWQDSESKILF